MTLVLCWDIDGTLLSTARAGVFAWEDAVEEILGQEISLADYTTAGLTDVEIARRLVGEVTGARDDERAARVLRRYGELLPSRLHRRTGGVLPRVRETLDHVRDRSDVHSMLLTGNIEAGARAKLTHYGLIDYFDLAVGAFSDDTEDRPAVARRALEIARRAVADLPAERLVVIGDTPHDIDCGKAVGARTVAVATGSYSTEELARHEPWWVLGELPEPRRFLARLEA